MEALLQSLRAAPKNMYSMVVTLEVSKATGWLNEVALLSMLAMFVTLEVSHPLRSSLNVEQAVLHGEPHEVAQKR